MIISEIMRYLDSRGIVTYDDTGATGNIFMGLLPPVPDIAVAITPSGGIASSIKHPYDQPTFQVLVRGDEDPRTGYNLALAIYDALHGFGSAPFIPGGMWVIKCEGIQSDPVHIGIDGKRRHRYAMNFMVEVARPSTHRG